MSVDTISNTSSNVNTITDTSFNAEHTETVNVPVAFLWKILLDKIEHPDRYIPGVSNVKILSHGDHFIERQMSMGRSVLHENITWNDDSYTIKFERHANDPHFTGCVYNIITPDPNGGAPSLTFRFAWHVKSENNDIAQEMIQDMSKSDVIQQAVQQTKKLAESDYQAQQKDQIKDVEYKQ